MGNQQSDVPTMTSWCTGEAHFAVTMSATIQLPMMKRRDNLIAIFKNRKPFSCSPTQCNGRQADIFPSNIELIQLQLQPIKELQYTLPSIPLLIQAFWNIFVSNGVSIIHSISTKVKFIISIFFSDKKRVEVKERQQIVKCHHFSSKKKPFHSFVYQMDGEQQ